MFPGRVRYLTPYEEAAGILHELVEEDGILTAGIAKIRIALPLDLEPKLRPLIGQRIAILRADIPEKPYLFRILDLGATSSEERTPM